MNAIVSQALCVFYLFVFVAVVCAFETLLWCILFSFMWLQNNVFSVQCYCVLRSAFVFVFVLTGKVSSFGV